MDANARREAIYQAIGKSDQPIKGGELARRFAVSRQVIVQDVALLRAHGREILATPDGYVLPAPERNGCVRVVMCRHTGIERMRQELYAVVDAGGVVEDVLVSHAVYGELRAPLLLRSRRQVDDFADHAGWKKAAPLSTLTGGVHYHTISAPDPKTLDAIVEALDAAGLLSQEEAP